MATLIENLAWNAAESSVLAVLVACTLRAWRLPAPAAHLLWLLVPIKLLMPPVTSHAWSLSAAVRQTIPVTKLSAAASSAQPLTQTRSTSLVVARSSDAYAEGVSQHSPGSRVFERTLGPQNETSSSTPTGLHTSAVSNPPVYNPFGVDNSLVAGPPWVRSSTRDPGLWSTAPLGWGGTRLDDDSAISNSASAEFGLRSPRSRFGFVWPWLKRCVVWGWAVGTLAIVLGRGWQLIALRRLVRAAAPANDEIVHDCSKTARRLGVARVPDVRVTREAVSPMVSAAGRGTIVLPEHLLQHAPRQTVRGVIAHELAHVARRDHWVAWIDLAAGCAYWWLPTYWYVRRALRRTADEAADAWAVWALGCRRTYAESLLKTAEILVARPRVATALGPALGEREIVARRLTMIMREPMCRRVSWLGRLGVGLVALMVLPSAPSRLRAQDPPDKPTVPSAEELDRAIETVAQRPHPPGREGGDRPAPPPNERRDQPAGDRDQPRPDARREAERGRERSAGDREQPRPTERRDAERGRERPDAPDARNTDQRLRALEQQMDRIVNMLERMQAGGGPRGDGPGPRSNLPGPPGFVPPRGEGRGTPGMAPGGPGGGPDQMLRMLQGLDLNDEQRKQVENIQRDAEGGFRELQAAHEQLTRRIQESIMKVLTPEQRERLQQRRPDGQREQPRPEAGRPEGDRPRGEAGQRRPEGDRPRGEAERRPEGDRPRGDAEQRRPGADRPRGDAGERRPEGDRPRGEAEQRRPDGPRGEGERGERPRREEGRRPEAERPAERR